MAKWCIVIVSWCIMSSCLVFLVQCLQSVVLKAVITRYVASQTSKGALAALGDACRKFVLQVNPRGAYGNSVYFNHYIQALCKYDLYDHPKFEPKQHVWTLGICHILPLFFCSTNVLRRHVIFVIASLIMPSVAFIFSGFVFAELFYILMSVYNMIVPKDHAQTMKFSFC